MVVTNSNISELNAFHYLGNLRILKFTSSTIKYAVDLAGLLVMALVESLIEHQVLKRYIREQKELIPH